MARNRLWRQKSGLLAAPCPTNEKTELERRAAWGMIWAKRSARDPNGKRWGEVLHVSGTRG